MEKLLNKITLKFYVKGLRKYRPEAKATDIYIRVKSAMQTMEK